jgi:putative endonuclease
VGRFWVYILTCSDGSLYTGITNNLEKRLAEHNSGLGSKYTRSRTPVALSYAEGASGRGEALRRENQIKRLSRSSKLLLCSRYSIGSRQSIR